MATTTRATDDGMTRRDRENLAHLTRQRAKLAKDRAKQRAAELIADGEAQLATIFQADDERWTAAVAVAQAAIARANAEIDRHCEEARIPASFRPHLHAQWWGRGENIDAGRRAELRRVLATRVDALAKQACVEIERQSVELQTALVAGGLDSAAARTFLQRMPTAEALMPGLNVHDFPEVAALTGGRGTLDP